MNFRQKIIDSLEVDDVNQEHNDFDQREYHHSQWRWAKVHLAFICAICENMFFNSVQLCCFLELLPI